MKRFATILICFALLAPDASAEPDNEFAAVVAAIQRGDQLVQQGQYRPAMDEYRKAQVSLLKFKTIYPQWDPQVVSFRLRYLGERLGNWNGPDDAKAAAEDAELQALHRRVQFLERSGQQYQAQISQLLSENNRLSVRLREALALRPAAQEPAVVVETQARLDTAIKEVATLQDRVKELETELAGIPKPDEARQNARSLDETRKSLRQALNEAETLRKQAAALREAPAPMAAPSSSAAQLADQLQAARVAQSAGELEVRRLRDENEQLRRQLAAAGTAARSELTQAPAGAALRRLDRARLAMSEGRLPEARQLLEVELAENQGSVEGWYLLGRVRLDAAEFPEAAQALQSALELSPDLGVAHRELTRLYLAQPAPDLALSRWHYHRALRLGAPREAALEKAIGWEQPASVK